jgi:hypothetical protein
MNSIKETILIQLTVVSQLIASLYTKQNKHENMQAENGCNKDVISSTVEMPNKLVENGRKRGKGADTRNHAKYQGG